MIAMALVLLVSTGNFILGFALAVHFGHGPMQLPLFKLPLLKKLLDTLHPQTETH